jgi:nucleotidyltransferase substrate binding protein (TIGR01987 family)
MEQTSGYENKLELLLKALDGFEKSMTLEKERFGEIEQDTIRSGQLQKFEVSVELYWKTIKKFLFEIHGIETVSPKTVIKQMYLTKYINEKDYERLLEMINERNRMSHVYNEELFELIHSKLAEYLQLMKKTSPTFQNRKLPD